MNLTTVERHDGLTPINNVDFTQPAKVVECVSNHGNNQNVISDNQVYVKLPYVIHLNNPQPNTGDKNAPSIV